MWKSRRQRRVVSAILGAALVWLVYLFFGPPVLINLRGGPFPGDWAMIAFNPARDRGPERASEAFLRLLKSGAYETALSQIETSDEGRQVSLKEETIAPLTTWRLIDREDKGRSSVVLTYAFRFPDGTGEGLLYTTMEKRDGQWRIKYYDRMY